MNENKPKEYPCPSCGKLAPDLHSNGWVYCDDCGDAFDVMDDPKGEEVVPGPERIVQLAHHVWNPPSGRAARLRVIDAILDPEHHRSRGRVALMAGVRLVEHTCRGRCSHEHCSWVTTDTGRAVAAYLQQRNQ